MFEIILILTLHAYICITAIIRQITLSFTAISQFYCTDLTYLLLKLLMGSAKMIFIALTGTISN